MTDSTANITPPETSQPPTTDPTAAPPAKREPGVRRQVQYAVVQKRPGKMITAKHRSFDLMLSMLIGMRTMVGRSVTEPERQISPQDFTEFRKLDFPSEGSLVTPPHPGRDFKFKDYAPNVFRHMREKFGIEAVDYQVSLTAEYDLSELGTPGKSGSVFYFTKDGRFVIKTISKSECVFLRHILPHYYQVCWSISMTYYSYCMCSM